MIALEPPVVALLPDREELRHAHEEMRATYLAGDRMGYWRKFLDATNIHMPPEMIEAVFGGPQSERDAARERYAGERMDMATTFRQSDIDALRASGTNLVVGIGDESADHSATAAPEHWQ